MPELTKFIENQGDVFTFNVRDKFSDYGLVGAVFVSTGVIQQFVMSCRILGKDIEVNVLKQILQHVRSQCNGPSIFGIVKPTEANGPCQDIFVRSGFQPTETTDTFEMIKDSFSQ